VQAISYHIGFLHACVGQDGRGVVIIVAGRISGGGELCPVLRIKIPRVVSWLVRHVLYVLDRSFEGVFLAYGRSVLPWVGVAHNSSSLRG